MGAAREGAMGTAGEGGRARRQLSASQPLSFAVGWSSARTEYLPLRAPALAGVEVLPRSPRQTVLSP